MALSFIHPTGTRCPCCGLDGSWLERRVSHSGDALASQGMERGFWAGGTTGLAHLSCPHDLSPHLHALFPCFGHSDIQEPAPRDSHRPRAETHQSPQPLGAASTQSATVRRLRNLSRVGKRLSYQLISCMLMATEAGNKSNSMSHAATSRRRPPPLFRVDLHQVSRLYLEF